MNGKDAASGQKYRRATLHWSTRPQGEQDEMEKPSLGVDWLKIAYDIVGSNKNGR